MSCGELTRDKKQQGRNSTKHVGFVYACAKKAKNKKLMMLNVATSRKSKNHN